jgi:hypothetical protein
MARYFGEYVLRLGLSQEKALALGRRKSNHQGDFCLTVLALRLSSHSNGVSKLQAMLTAACGRGFDLRYRLTKSLSSTLPMGLIFPVGFHRK